MNLIVAINNKHVIGDKETIPWHCSDDLKMFKKLTTGNVVVMGRKTYGSLAFSNGLANITNVVLTRNKNLRVGDGVLKFVNHEDVINHFKDSEKEIFIIGGAEIYKLFAPYIKKMYISIIDDDSDGDTVFPMKLYIENYTWFVRSIDDHKTFSQMIIERKDND